MSVRLSGGKCKIQQDTFARLRSADRAPNIIHFLVRNPNPLLGVPEESASSVFHDDSDPIKFKEGVFAKR